MYAVLLQEDSGTASIIRAVIHCARASSRRSSLATRIPGVTAVAACVLLAGFGVACGGNSRSPTGFALTQPTTTTPTPTGPTADPNLWTLDGRVLQTVANTPVSGATIVFPDGIGQTTSDATGAFHFESTTRPTLSRGTNYAVTIAAPGSVTRTMVLAWSKKSSVTLDVIADRLPFVLSFYRDLVRDHYDAPTASRPVARWTQEPKFYMRTVDSTGRTVEPEVLASVQDSLRRGMSSWTGGRWGGSTIELGAEDRPLVSGWVNISYDRNPNTLVCGTATVGATGRMMLNIDRCSCGSIKVTPGVVVHELGHTLGFWHVPPGSGIMGPQISGGCYAADPTAQEKFHALLAYQRPNGNTDVDDDSLGSAPFQPASLVVID